jgi:hypothetical protein
VAKINSQEDLKSIAPAVELLVLLARESPDKDLVAQLMKRPPDWKLLFADAEEHRITPILYGNLKTYSDIVPPHDLDNLRNRVLEIGKLNFARTAQLIKLVKVIQSQQLDVLCYKGMALAALAYRDVALREYTDIDVLIRKKEFFQIKTLLLANKCLPAHEFSESEERAALKYTYDYPFYHDENNTLIEVHWDFIEFFFAFDYYSDEIWDRVIEIEMYGTKIRTLSPEDYLIVLSTHGSKHFWNRLAWVCDIDRLVRNTKIDWELVRSRAAAVDALRMIRIGLLLSNKLLNTPIPETEAIGVQGDRNASQLADEFADSLFEDEKEKHSDWIRMAKRHLRMREKLSIKIKYCWRLLKVKLLDKLFMPMGRPQ